MTCEQGLLRLLWGGARSWSVTALGVTIGGGGIHPGGSARGGTWSKKAIYFLKQRFNLKI